MVGDQGPCSILCVLTFAHTASSRPDYRESLQRLQPDTPSKGPITSNTQHNSHAPILRSAAPDTSIYLGKPGAGERRRIASRATAGCVPAPASSTFFSENMLYAQPRLQAARPAEQPGHQRCTQRPGRTPVPAALPAAGGARRGSACCRVTAPSRHTRRWAAAPSLPAGLSRRRARSQAQHW